MISILAFSVFYLLTTEMMEDVISVGEVYALLLLIYGLYASTLPLLSNDIATEYFQESLSAIAGGAIPLLLQTFVIVNSKKLLNLTTQRWRPEERENFT